MKDQDVPAGFQETTLGLLPGKWEVVNLGDVAEIRMGQSPPSSTYNQDGIGLPFLQGKAEFRETFPAPTKWCSAPLKVACEGDILISVRAPVGDVNIASSNCCIGRGLAALSFQRADSFFGFYWLRFAKRLLEAEGTGTTFQSINRSVLEKLAFPLPPLPEQRAIAGVLRTVQQAIAATEQAIAAARELKRSLLQHLFTYGPVAAGEAGKVPLHETEIGLVPGSWGIVRVGDIFEIKLGKMLSQASKKGVSPRPYLRNANVQWGHIDVRDIYEMDFTTREMDLFRLRKDDLLVCEGGEIGRTAIWEDQFPECYYQKAIHRLRPKQPNALPRFFLYYMMLVFLIRRVPIVQGARSTIAHLPVEKLAIMPAVLPSLLEQREIIGLLAAVDRKIAAEQAHRAALQSLFESLLQNLMTGRVRMSCT